jgi:hypothetical protein
MILILRCGRLRSAGRASRGRELSERVRSRRPHTCEEPGIPDWGCTFDF